MTFIFFANFFFVIMHCVLCISTTYVYLIITSDIDRSVEFCAYQKYVNRDDSYIREKKQRIKTASKIDAARESVRVSRA